MRVLKIVLAASLVLLMAVGCSYTSSSNISEGEYPATSPVTSSTTSTTSEKENSEAPLSEQSPNQTEAAPTTEATSEPPEELAQQLPYIGMPEAWVDRTFLGQHVGDIEYLKKGERIGSYLIKENCRRYSWYSLNGKDDRIFSVHCAHGEVIDTFRAKLFTTYWPEAGGLPDLYATGEKRTIGSSTLDKTPPSPYDYNYEDADDYAEDVWKWFEKNGYENPYEAAVEYYELNGP